MFKELLATALLSTCVSTGALRDISKQNLINNYYNTSLMGGYCMPSTTVLDETVKNYIISTGGETITFNPSFPRYTAYAYENSNDLVGWITFTSFSFTVQYWSAELGYRLDFDMEYQDGNSITGTWYEGDDLTDLSTKFQTLMFYFPVQYNFYDDIGAYAFTSVFGNNGNYYVDVYTGWYTFNDNITFSEEQEYYGNFSVNNSLFNYMYCVNDDIIFSYQTSESDITSIEPYSDGTWLTAKTVFFDHVMLLKTDTAYLNTKGVFSYIPNPPNYDLTNYLFGIMDAPIYVFYSLFNFELLGMNLFIAICSLITLACAFFILRLIIKFN